jgi:hypothetical protein
MHNMLMESSSNWFSKDCGLIQNHVFGIEKYW